PRGAGGEEFGAEEEELEMVATPDERDAARRTEGLARCVQMNAAAKVDSPKCAGGGHDPHEAVAAIVELRGAIRNIRELALDLPARLDRPEVREESDPVGAAAEQRARVTLGFDEWNEIQRGDDGGGAVGADLAQQRPGGNEEPVLNDHGTVR